jgi:HEAT repeats
VPSWLQWLSLAACESLWPAPARPALENELSAGDIAAAEGISTNLVSGRFPSDVAENCVTNGPRFVWLGAAHSDPAVVRAALFAAAGCASSVDGTVHLTDLASAASAHVGESDRRTLIAALTAARLSVAAVPGDHPLVATLVGRTRDRDPAIRYEVLSVLNLRPWGSEPAVVSVFLANLGDDVPRWLVTETLAQARGQASHIVEREPLRQRALVRVNDLDPGIRGRAALLLAALGVESSAERDLLLALLDDPHGFVRSAAAEALSEIGYRPAIHALLARIDDIERNTYDMEAYARLDGTSVVPHHAGSPYERVDDAYLWALAKLSEPLGDERFVYREVNLRWRDLDIIAASRDARKWYEAHREQIPPLE